MSDYDETTLLVQSSLRRIDEVVRRNAARTKERDAKIRNFLAPIAELLDYQPDAGAVEVHRDAREAYTRIVALLEDS